MQQEAVRNTPDSLPPCCPAPCCGAARVTSPLSRGTYPASPLVSQAGRPSAGTKAHRYYSLSQTRPSVSPGASLASCSSSLHLLQRPPRQVAGHASLDVSHSFDCVEDDVTVLIPTPKRPLAVGVATGAPQVPRPPALNADEVNVSAPQSVFTACSSPRKERALLHTTPVENGDHSHRPLPPRMGSHPGKPPLFPLPRSVPAAGADTPLPPRVPNPVGSAAARRMAPPTRPVQVLQCHLVNTIHADAILSSPFAQQDAAEAAAPSPRCAPTYKVPQPAALDREWPEDLLDSSEEALSFFHGAESPQCFFERDRSSAWAKEDPQGSSCGLSRSESGMTADSVIKTEAARLFQRDGARRSCQTRQLL